MDPQAAFNEMIEACSLNDYPVACECANSLLQWMVRGGFAPDVTIHFAAFNHTIRGNSQLVRLLCQAVLDREHQS